MRKRTIKLWRLQDDGRKLFAGTIVAGSPAELVAHGDRLNAILCGVGQNVRLLLRWFTFLLCFFLGWLYDAVLLRRVSPA